MPSAGDKAGCNIKGKINERGEHIHHMPGQSYYLETGVNLARRALVVLAMGSLVGRLAQVEGLALTQGKFAFGIP
ncbi:hypothetical protein ACHMW7_26115 [Aminobacter sp. UC22_36]|uniref:hypothetical protein n=1 Tax=Aminobacter sp. UC22_36 TaxID=3374549 RepID=UPI0037565E13